jgi:Cu/Ag efflux pump CusA
MMRWIVGTCLQFRLLIVVTAGLLLLFGIRQLSQMPVDVLPEFSRPYVELQTEALGLSAEEVEAMITTPMEADMLNGAPWVEEIRSESMPGLSSIKMYFEPGTDILEARQMVQERLIEVYALPAVSRPPVMLQPVSSANRVVQVGLTSDELSLIEMSVLARWTVKPRLMGVPGVANVSIFGQRERQLQVRVDPQQLHDQGVSLDQIIATTGNSLWSSPLTWLDAAVPGTGGFIDTPNQRLTILHLNSITTADELGEVVIAGTDKRLKDVAEVVEDHQLLIGDAIVHDAPSLTLVVEKFPWASTTQVTNDVEKALVALGPAVGGMKMDASLFRPATYIATATSNMRSALLISGGLVAAALLLFLGSWRSAVIGIVAIGTSVIAAGLVLYLLGVKVNFLIIMGLLVGVVAIIDDAVVDVHNIARRLRQHGKRGSAESVPWVIREAIVEMRGVLVYSTLIVLMALAPAFFMGGISGAFLQPAAYAYVLAVVSSLLVGLTVTPVLSVVLYADRIGADEPAKPNLIATRYAALVAPLLSRPQAAFAVVAALVVVAGAVAVNIRQEALTPTFKETDVVIDLDAKPGTSHPAMSRIVMEMSGKLRSTAGVKSVAAQIGRAITSDEVSDVNSAEIWATLDPQADHETTMAAIRAVVDGGAADLVDRDVQTFLADRIDDALAGEGHGLVVRVYGDDLKKVEELANSVAKELKTTNGVYNPEVEAPEMLPRIEIEPDIEKCKAHGIKPGEVRRTAAVLLSGLEVGNLFDQQKVFEVVVWGKPEVRKDVDNVKNLLIETQKGLVPLVELADVRLSNGPTSINREAVARYIDVVADVSGRDLGAIGADVKNMLGHMHFPLEYRAEMLGAPAERLANQQTVLTYAVAALIGIYLVLQVAVNSWRVAWLILLMLPLALIGGLVAALASGGVISYGSLLGFVAVLTIAVRSFVLLVRQYQELQRTEQDMDVDSQHAQFVEKTPLNDVGEFDEISPELVIEGTRQRAVPMFVSTAAIMLACLPPIALGTIAGLEILRPMALVLFGGMVTTTLVSLYVLPPLYLWLKSERLPDIVTDPIPVTVEREVEPAPAT